MSNYDLLPIYSNVKHTSSAIGLGFIIKRKNFPKFWVPTFFQNYSMLTDNQETSTYDNQNELC